MEPRPRCALMVTPMFSGTTSLILPTPPLTCTSALFFQSPVRSMLTDPTPALIFRLVMAFGEALIVVLDAPESTVSVRTIVSVSYTHLRAHETRHDLVCRL